MGIKDYDVVTHPSSEIWKDIPGYEGMYQVSNLGNFRSLDRTIKRHNNSTMKRKGSLLKTSKDKDGYLLINLTKNNKAIKGKVHRIVAEVFLDNENNYPCVNHINGIKDDNRVENLEWCSYKQNSIHARDNGLLKPAKGIRNGSHKLTEADVIKIKGLVRSGRSMSSVAKEYNVAATSIRYIMIGRNWKYVKEI